MGSGAPVRRLIRRKGVKEDNGKREQGKFSLPITQEAVTRAWEDPWPDRYLTGKGRGNESFGKMGPFR